MLQTVCWSHWATYKKLFCGTYKRGSFSGVQPWNFELETGRSDAWLASQVYAWTGTPTTERALSFSNKATCCVLHSLRRAAPLEAIFGAMYWRLPGTHTTLALWLGSSVLLPARTCCADRHCERVSGAPHSNCKGTLQTGTCMGEHVQSTLHTTRLKNTPGSRSQKRRS